MKRKPAKKAAKKPAKKAKKAPAKAKAKPKQAPAKAKPAKAKAAKAKAKTAKPVKTKRPKPAEETGASGAAGDDGAGGDPGEAISASAIQERIAALVGNGLLESGEMSMPIQIIDWSTMDPDDRKTFAFAHLYMFNFERGGDGERIVFDREYVPIGELTIDEDKVAVLCELATGKTFVSGGHTATELMPFAPSLDALVGKIRAAN